MNSLSLSLIVATLCVFLGTVLVITIEKSRTWPQRIVDLFSLLPNTVSGIVMVVVSDLIKPFHSNPTQQRPYVPLADLSANNSDATISD